MDFNEIVHTALTNLPQELDLTDARQFIVVHELLDTLRGLNPAIEQVCELEKQLVQKTAVPLALQLAMKLLRSQLLVESITQKLHVTVVFAMYKEHRRILPVEQDEVGEDFLVRKVAQLEALFGDKQNISWRLVAVDDGCPEGSGKIARQIVADRNWQDRVLVLYLDDAIQSQLQVSRPMLSTSDSQKGGAVLYGMWHAATQQHLARGVRHVVCYTDADLSTHLGQIGLLVEPIINQNKRVAIGSRREALSVVAKKGTRNTRGKLFIYLWKKMLPPLRHLVDTQCGFKAFDAELVRQISENIVEKKFAFDLELLLNAELRHPGCIAKVAIAWIDSEEASTTTELEPYLAMLQSVAAMNSVLVESGQGNDESQEFANFVLGLSEAKWHELVAKMPSSIAEADPSDPGFINGPAVSELCQRIQV